MRSVDDEIRRAAEQGQFDNLPGKGRPLKLEDNPYEDPGWRLAFRALRNAGYSLPWIEQRQEILAELEQVRERLRAARRWSQPGQGDDPEANWQQAVDRFRTAIDDLNAHIRTYNLHAPGLQFQLPALDAERELELTTRPPSDTLPQP